MLPTGLNRVLLAGLAGGVVAAPAALAAAPKLIGNAMAGKAVFAANCAACHTLKAAGAVGVNGPNLDKLPLPEATTIKATQIGGPIMGAAGKKWPIRMQGYKTVLSAKQIRDVAAFVYVSTHR
jgi:mono/diheme cytochrome c family protein